jgi:translation initiation factor 2B subunit (eIF-2B alpha/beta/delta family)
MSSNTLKKTLLKSHRASQSNDSAFSAQIQGNHYKTLKIQPLEYSMANGFNACQTHVVKYISRYNKKWKDKKDQIKDLQKAKHVIDMQIELLEKE